MLKTFDYLNLCIYLRKWTKSLWSASCYSWKWIGTIMHTEDCCCDHKTEWEWAWDCHFGNHLGKRSSNKIHILSWARDWWKKSLYEIWKKSNDLVIVSPKRTEKWTDAQKDKWTSQNFRALPIFLSISSRDIERKQKSGINQAEGP